MSLETAFHVDARGVYAFQDPDEDLDWFFDFRDATEPTLQVGEDIDSIIELVLRREDGAALGTAEKHDQSHDGDKVVVFVRGLVKGEDRRRSTYWLECTIETTNTPPRRISDQFRLICGE